MRSLHRSRRLGPQHVLGGWAQCHSQQVQPLMPPEGRNVQRGELLPNEVPQRAVARKELTPHPDGRAWGPCRRPGAGDHSLPPFLPLGGEGGEGDGRVQGVNRCPAPRRTLVAVTRGGYLRRGAVTLLRFSELNETPSLCSSQGPPGKDGLPGHPGQRGETVSILGARPSLPSAAPTGTASAARRPREDVGMGPVWGERTGQPHVTSREEGRCWFQGHTQNLHDTHDATGTFFPQNNPETPAPRRLTLAVAGPHFRSLFGGFRL